MGNRLLVITQVGHPLLVITSWSAESRSRTGSRAASVYPQSTTWGAVVTWDLPGWYKVLYAHPMLRRGYSWGGAVPAYVVFAKPDHNQQGANKSRW